MMDKISLWILLIGGLNWGLVGIFRFDLIAWVFGGSDSLVRSYPLYCGRFGSGIVFPQKRACR